MKHDNRMITAGIFVMNKACAPAVVVEAVAMLLVVEPSVVNGLAHSPGKGTPQLAHSAAVV